jgi:hypothetical protein
MRTLPILFVILSQFSNGTEVENDVVITKIQSISPGNMIIVYIEPFSLNQHGVFEVIPDKRKSFEVHSAAIVQKFDGRTLKRCTKDDLREGQVINMVIENKVGLAKFVESIVIFPGHQEVIYDKRK